MDVIIYLIGETTTGKSARGDAVKTQTERKVFASLSSVRQSEFYQAQTNGMQPEKMFIVRSREYKDERLLKHNNIVYTIDRTYDNGTNTEIVCSKGVR